MTTHRMIIDLYSILVLTIIASSQNCFQNHSLHIFELFSSDIILHQLIFHLKEVVFVHERDICFISHNHSDSNSPQLIYWSPLPHDRSCLVAPPVPPEREQALYQGGFNVDTLTSFINQNSFKFRQTDGTLSVTGKLIAFTLPKLHRVSSEAICDRIDISELKESTFLRNYLTLQRPLVIEKFIDFKNISILHLLSDHLKQKVGVKLSPSSEFEGIDDLIEWGTENSRRIPALIEAQLQSPDKVVVRAAHEEMTLEDFLLLLTRSMNVTTECDEVHAYIEYLPLSYYLPGFLESAIPSENYSRSILDNFINGKPYLWLGDGNTVGKTHFDPFDNLLIQLEGSKTFLMTDPSNSDKLLEGHMREAELRVRSNGSQRFCHFVKDVLSESTSIVHSPISLNDVTAAQDIPTMSCTVHQGDALFVPSFWWHEVYSSPGPSQSYRGDYIQLNAAINYWFEPLYTKEFPCAKCSKHLNKKYGIKLNHLFKVEGS